MVMPIGTSDFGWDLIKVVGDIEMGSTGFAYIFVGWHLYLPMIGLSQAGLYKGTITRPEFDQMMAVLDCISPLFGWPYIL
jgi:hypothetical protein